MLLSRVVLSIHHSLPAWFAVRRSPTAARLIQVEVQSTVLPGQVASVAVAQLLSRLRSHQLASPNQEVRALQTFHVYGRSGMVEHGIRFALLASWF